MYQTMKKLILGFLFFALKLNIFASGFEGKITIIKESCFDTTYFTYYVSANKIRIDEYNSSKLLINSYLINTINEEVFAVNTDMKLYTKLQKRSCTESSNDDYTINKTTNYKEINGVKCYQWRVKNREKNTEIAYWVNKNDFTFFDKMVKILNNTNCSWEFYNHIPKSTGCLPMLSVERNLVRDEKNRTQVLQISRKPIESSVFIIPSDYKLLVM
jgi:hypothetical protein